AIVSFLLFPRRLLTTLFPTRRSSDLVEQRAQMLGAAETASRAVDDDAYRAIGHSEILIRFPAKAGIHLPAFRAADKWVPGRRFRSEEHTSELQSSENLVFLLLLVNKK